MSEFKDLNFNKAKSTNIKIPSIKIPKKSLGIIIVAILVIAFLISGFYTINPDEAGVLQRFGKYIKTSSPGLNFKIPFGIDKLTKVKITRVFKEEFGFRTTSAGVKSTFSQQEYPTESIMLTGDLNVADVEWIVQYKIKDPYKYLFNIRNITNTIRNLSEAVIRRLVGDRSVDEVIVLSRQEIADEAQKELQKELDNYNAGIQIAIVKLQNVNPPQPVQPAFNDVNSAKQEEEKTVNNAWQEYNRVIPEAEGKAKEILEKAKGYAVNRVNRATGEADRFSSIYKEFRKSKEVTKKRIYLETMGDILTKVENIYIVDDNQQSVLPLLNLGKEVK